MTPRFLIAFHYFKQCFLSLLEIVYFTSSGRQNPWYGVGVGFIFCCCFYLLLVNIVCKCVLGCMYVCIYRCVCIHTLRNFCFLLLLFLLLHFRVVICHQVVKLQGQSVSFQNFGRHCQIISLFSLSRWYQWTSTPYQMRRGAYFFHSLINTKYLKYSCLLIRWVKMVI